MCINGGAKLTGEHSRKDHGFLPTHILSAQKIKFLNQVLPSYLKNE